LAPEGVATFEFPHLLRLVEGCQFDTIYHEHYSYLSLLAVTRIFASQGLRVFDVEEIATHGGSLRVFAARAGASHATTPEVARVLDEEVAAGMTSIDFYRTLGARALAIKLDLVEFLITQKRRGRRVAAYGAAAKGSTLLNYAGVHADLIDFVCDAAQSKQGLFLPGSHVPILPPEALRQQKPDYVLILPWNLRQEILSDHSYVQEWGGHFVVAVPKLEIL